jgi:hypothetical protein
MWLAAIVLFAIAIVLAVLDWERPKLCPRCGIDLDLMWGTPPERARCFKCGWRYGERP